MKRLDSGAPLACLLTMAVLVWPLAVAQATEWSTRLQDGSRVTVDPNTNRATVTREGVTTQLWDGTHRTQDGSILIIRRGTAVPNEPVMEMRQLAPPEPEDWEGFPIAGYSPCEELVRHVCGKQNQCADAEACNPARQLLKMEDEERDASRFHSRMTYTSGQCKKARKDVEYFTPCTAPETAEKGH
jgi:hypothetical protein